MTKSIKSPYNSKKYILILASQALSILVFAVLLIPKFVRGTDENAIDTVVQHEPSVILSLLPQDSTHQVGETIPLQLYVNLNNSSAANAFGVTLHYSTEYLKVIEIDTEGSICTLFPENSVDNATGEATLSCGLPSPGLLEPFGFLGTLQVELLKEGYATVNIEEASQVLANDGQGTNILTSVQNTGINVVGHQKAADIPFLTNKPTDETLTVITDIELLPVRVVSPTHPQQQKWYSNNSVEFVWEKTSQAITSYSYILNNKPDTIPNGRNGVDTTSVSFFEVQEGVSYFHIMPIAGNLDLPVSHFQIQIDTDTPKDLKVISAESFGDDKFWTVDLDVKENNGIDRFEVLHADGTSTKSSNPVRLILNNKFENTVTIVVYDLGGNSTSIDYDLPLSHEPTVWDKVARWWNDVTDYIGDL